MSIFVTRIKEFFGNPSVPTLQEYVNSTIFFEETERSGIRNKRVLKKWGYTDEDIDYIDKKNGLQNTRLSAIVAFLINSKMINKGMLGTLRIVSKRDVIQNED